MLVKQMLLRFRNGVALRVVQAAARPVVPGWQSIAIASPLLAQLLLPGCGLRPEGPQDRQVSFTGDVYPILQARCLHCHLPPEGKGYVMTGLSMRSYADIMRGTRYGPVVVAGDSRHSILSMLVEGRAGAAMRMPYHQAPLEATEIKTLQRWIEQGALNN